MRKYLLALPLVACAIAQPAWAVPLAPGTSIATEGFVIANTTPPGGTLSQASSLDFTTTIGVPSPGVPGALNSYGTGTGSFTGFLCNNPGFCGTIQDIASLAVGPQSIPTFAILTGGNNLSPIIFNLTGISDIDRTRPLFLTFTATGTIAFDGFDTTPGQFLFSAQGNTITSFSATALSTAVPESATWAMMLLGFGGIGMALRRRRRPALAQIA